TITEQSGDATITKSGGSSLCRMSFWQYVLTRVETGSLPKTEVAQKLIDYRDLLKNSAGKLKGKHLQSKLMSKTCNLLYLELVKDLVN
ncbi:MAG: transposase, partial [Rivularia sp. (in: cyanobacteria)]